jgi:ATP-dependent DNA helicase RecG
MTRFFAPFDLRVALLTGSTRAAEKRKIYAALQAGEIDLLVGTHALLTPDVTFRRLGLVITDEQHRFGVEQRAVLGEKGKNPHILVMSATPIPRTLALMIYGDLDVCVLDELPPGRKPVKTYAITGEKRERALRFVRDHLDRGLQAYIVCPLVEEGETPMAAAEEYAAQLREGAFRDYSVGLLHGRMRPKEKEAVMRAFASGEVQLLVSTTVIEVGVDVPNAVIMVIENAERFGLSQLHQLRGRIGRGQASSTCILISDAQNDEALRRLRILTQTNDGFKIADEDLRMRGPGDFFGARQHGLPEMKIADLISETQLVHEAGACAEELLRRDPELSAAEHRPLRAAVEKLWSGVGSSGMN